MFTPQRSTFPSPNSSNAEQSTSVVLTLQFSGQSVVVTHDGFTIGSSQRCDLPLNDTSIPGLHSVIHIQSGAIWIEAANDDTTVIVNHRPYRRMALRHEDCINIGSTELKILMINESITEVEVPALEEDLSLLSAEELCDRILSEQSMVSEFIEGRRSGWEALLQAIQAANDEPLLRQSSNDEVANQVSENETFETLLDEIQGLNTSITEHTRELSDHEKELLESTLIMEESQMRAIQQLDDILEKLKNSDPPNELRASA